MSPKMTTMVLNTVDLQCSCCYKKVKKVLCKFPEIRDQVYDEKNSKVTIKVLCCNPEMIRDKLCCKGRKVIKSIQIVDDTPKTKVPEKKEPETKAPEKKKPETKTPEKKEPETKAPEKKAPETKAPEKKAPETKTPEKKAPETKAPEKKAPEKKEPEKDPNTKTPKLVPVCGPNHGFPPMPMDPSGACCGTCAQGYGGGPCYQGYGRPVPEKSMYPNGACCGTCAQGYGGGPCYQGYGRPVPSPPGPCYDYGRPGPCYDYGRPVPPPPGPCFDYGYGYRGSKCCVSTDYFSEENPQGCTIM